MEFYLGKNDLGQEFKFVKNDILSFKLYIGKNSQYVDYGSIARLFLPILDKYVYAFYISSILEENQFNYCNFSSIDRFDEYLGENYKISLTKEFKDYVLGEEIMEKLME